MAEDKTFLRIDRAQREPDSIIDIVTRSWAGFSSSQIPAEARHFSRFNVVQTGSGACPISNSVGAEVLP
jgi:hypothetical protein